MSDPKVTLVQFVERLNSANLHNQLTRNAVMYALEDYPLPRNNGYNFYEGHVFPVTLHVMDYFQQFNIPLRQEVVAASLLHDALEDTLIDDKRFIKKFGQEVYQLVKPLTRPEIWELNVRQGDDIGGIKKEVYYAQLRSAPLESKVIKLADRYNNMSSLNFRGDARESRVSSYIQEAEEFYLEFARSVDMQIGSGTYWHDLFRRKTEELKWQTQPLYKRAKRRILSLFQRNRIIKQKP